MLKSQPEDELDKGEDAILWGKWEEDDLEYERLEEGTCPKPYWTEKQMRRRGEPQRKTMRRESPGEKEEERADEEDEKENNKKMRTQWKKQDDEDEKKKATNHSQEKISMKEQRLIRAERRERWKIKKSIREKNKKEKERKQKKAE